MQVSASLHHNVGGMQSPESWEEFEEMLEAAGDVPVQIRFTQQDCEACEYAEEFSDGLAADTDDLSMQFISVDIDVVG